MAKIKSVDQAVVLTSSLTNEQIKRALKYFPEALVLTEKNEDGKNVPVFAIGETKNEPKVSKVGISFVLGDKNELASVTVTIGKMKKSDRENFVKDNYGKALVNLIKIEKQYEEVAKAFDKEYASLDSNIEIC